MGSVLYFKSGFIGAIKAKRCPFVMDPKVVLLVATRLEISLYCAPNGLYLAGFSGTAFLT